MDLRRKSGRSTRPRTTTAAADLALVLGLLGLWIVALETLRPSGASTAATVAVAAGAWCTQLLVSTTRRGSRFAGTRAYQTSQPWIGAAAALAMAIVLARILDVAVGVTQLAVAFAAAAITTAVVQEYRTIRQSGSQPSQRAVIIGTGEEVREWIDLVDAHPEMGIEVVGCIGDAQNAARVGLAERWLGPSADLLTIVENERIDLPIVAVTSFRRPALQSIVGQLEAHGYDVAISWGVGRLSTARLHSMTFSHETLPVIKAQRRTSSEELLKRLLDVVASAVLLTLTSPILLACAVAIRLDSRGPALFRQRRVGLNAEEFDIIKLRTMTVEAEELKAELTSDNERSGPLFKMTHDPRVTRVGKLLRATSLDEIPQLFNVLRGEMSLVGPRPALPDETETFDPELRKRSAVRPGITGLWQLEARANSSFDAYRRLDLHYLENWSLSFDLRIMIATAQLLVLGPIVGIAAKLVAGRSGESVAPATGVAAPVEAPAVEARRVGVVGAGYVGLTQAVGLAGLGHRVVCADIDEVRVAELRAGIPPVLEQGLEQQLAECNKNGLLRFTTDPAAAAVDADVVFLCVPTPQSADGAADLTHVRTAVEQIAPHLRPGAVLATKSTVPVGTAGFISSTLNRADVQVVSNPEFLREGTALADWHAPARIVVGGLEEACERVLDLYAPIPGHRVTCDTRSAELTKYASNAYLATRLTFVNSLGVLCEELDADIDDVVAAMGLDPRIGAGYLQVGPGWGGSCLPKDTRALAHQARDAGVDFVQLDATIDANDAHVQRAVDTVLGLLPADVSDPTVGVLGMAFKAGTSDTRESPAIKLIETLVERGVTVRAFDPAVVRCPVPNADDANNAIDCARGADIVAIATGWAEFADLDLKKIEEVMRRGSLVDFRHVLDRHKVVAHGLTYHSIGRAADV